MPSSQWHEIPQQIRLRSIFSANVHNARFLQVINSEILQTLARWAAAKSKQDYLQVRQDFVATLGRVAIEEGMGPLIPLGVGYEDISSATRLKLVFDTLVRQAYGYANYAHQLQRQQDYPLARFIRHPGARTKRPLHELNENVIKPFADVQWWIYMNNRQLGGFEVPWPPYGYNSWMDRVPVSRQLGISLGLIDESYQPPPVQHPGFNDKISVNVEHLSKPILKKLRKALGKQVTLSRNNLIFHPHAK